MHGRFECTYADNKRTYGYIKRTYTCFDRIHLFALKMRDLLEFQLFWFFVEPQSDKIMQDWLEIEISDIFLESVDFRTKIIFTFSP